jgi:membrane-bound lytic murein transglycosylase MltF
MADWSAVQTTMLYSDLPVDKRQCRNTMRIDIKRFHRSLIAGFLAVLMLSSGAPAYSAQEVLDHLSEPWKGDFKAMLERRKIRALVVYNKLMYFLDGATQRGATYDGLKLFEKYINEKYKLKTRKLDVVFIPVPRDRLLPALREGLGDIAAANLTITPERLKHVDFSNPLHKDVTEVLVTGPSAPSVGHRDDLAGQTIHVRKSSSYFSSLTALNRDFKKRGLKPIKLVPADEYLEDSDLLEMVNAGLLPMIVVDNHKAQFWQDIFENIKVHPNITVREGGQIAWAFRKNSPILNAVVNQFVARHKKGTLTGNIILKRYFKENKWVRNSLSKHDLEKFNSMLDLFEKYAGDYDFDWAMLTALAYQESRLDQSKRSKAGAIGVMQMLPTTAKDPNVGIPDIDKLESNIHAGTKYLRFLRDRYFSDPKINDVNQTLLAFAAYNAGPARVARLRKEAAQRKLYPNEWFGHVEIIAAKRIGRETVQYVSNIYKYFIAYKLVIAKLDQRQVARDKMRKESAK